MSLCTESCRTPTGTRMEHCKVCHQTFTGNTLGNAHRVDAGSYVLASALLTGTPVRFETEEDVPAGWKIHSSTNMLRRCLTVEEMKERGWRLVGGVWKGAQVEGEGWWKKSADDTDEDFSWIDEEA